MHMPAKPVATVCLCNLENGHPERTLRNFFMYFGIFTILVHFGSLVFYQYFAFSF